MLQKRFIILNEVNDSGIRGTVKLERFLDETSIEGNILGAKEFSIVVKIENDIFVIKEGHIKFLTEKEFNASSFLQAIVIVNNNTVSAGSSYGLSISYKDLYEEYEKQLYKEQEIIKEEETKEKVEIKVEEKKEEKIFYKKIERKLEELFSKHEHDEDLEIAIDNSKWVKILIENNDYYVVGIIYSDNLPKVICYGIPASQEEMPNEDFSQWIKTSNCGYWMTFQSLIDGSIIKNYI